MKMSFEDTMGSYVLTITRLFSAVLNITRNWWTLKNNLLSYLFYIVYVYLTDSAAVCFGDRNNLNVGMSHEVMFNGFISENVFYCRCFHWTVRFQSFFGSRIESVFNQLVVLIVEKYIRLCNLMRHFDLFATIMNLRS